LAVAGDLIAPYGYQEIHISGSGVMRAASPSIAHPLGTTSNGYDVLSRVIIGARPTIITALLGGAMISSIGLSIGVTSGYMGGRIDNLLMRFTDIAYSVPLIPFAIVILAYLGVGFIESVVVIGLLLWRGSARVLRSQVLQIRERPYIMAAKATGASSPRIIFKHVIPNIAPMAILFFAMGMGWAVVMQAGLAFIGVSDPFVPSWGIIIRNAYDSGYLGDQPFWAIVPGLMIALTVLSAFILGREFETEEGSTIAGQTGDT
jgi:peptide/nickel transport system permease protein